MKDMGLKFLLDDESKMILISPGGYTVHPDSCGRKRCDLKGFLKAVAYGRQGIRCLQRQGQTLTWYEEMGMFQVANMARA